jgi:hypothetical protein
MIIGRRSASVDVSSEDVSMTELTKRRGCTRQPRHHPETTKSFCKNQMQRGINTSEELTNCDESQLKDHH